MIGTAGVCERARVSGMLTIYSIPYKENVLSFEPILFLYNLLHFRQRQLLCSEQFQDTSFVRLPVSLAKSQGLALSRLSGWAHTR